SHAEHEARGEQSANVGTSWDRRQRTARARETLCKHLRSGSRLIEVDVVERRIIQHAEAAAERGLAISGQEAAPLRRIDKARRRSKAVLGSRNGGVGATAQGQRRIPEGSRRVAFALCGDGIEQVSRLAVVGPGEAELDGQVLADLPVVAAVNEGVILT